MPTPNLRADEQEAERVLKELGLRVSRVPTSSSKTPDFAVEGDARGYLFEVKARQDSEAWTRAIKRGQVAFQKRSMGYGHWAEDVASDAAKQFRSVDAQHLRWWVLWLAIQCVASPDAMAREVIGTLFGVRQVVYHDHDSKAACSRDCLFAIPGVFERHPEIVACVVDIGNALCLCVNDEFSGDFNSFRESVLFARIHPPTTATDLTQNRGYLRVDLSVDREDDSALQAYLERVYGLEKPIMLDAKLHSASIVPSLRKDSTT
jgi:hypothetical protein